MLQSLDAAAVRRWASTCCDELAARRDELDVLNVFPVADRDTGSNLLATMRAGLDAMLRDSAAGAPGPAAAALARGATRGARGNSGVIISQVLRGLAEPLSNGARPPAWSAAELRAGLRRADELATAAVAHPMPGTVLTVLHAAAQAVDEDGASDLATVAAAAASAATCALSDTPNQLGALARAGVVDAGGLGLVLLLEALVAVVTERPPSVSVSGRVPAGEPAAAPDEQAVGGAEYGYEVMFLLDGSDATRVAALRADLAGLGDCVAVVAADERDPLWTVHVHCFDVGAALEAGVRAGRPHRITVERLNGRGERTTERFATAHTVLALVGASPESGVAELLRGEGAVVLPATCEVTELFAVLAGTGARQVTVLAPPGDPAGVAAEAAAQARESGQEVVVIPTLSAVQALSAMAVHDLGRRAADDVVAMSEAAAATRRGEVVVAATAALTWAGRCEPGAVLGMVDDEVVVIGADPLATACDLLDRMLAVGGELVTVLLGDGTADGVGDGLLAHLRAAHREVEAVCYPGGQPGNVLSVGVE